MMTRLLATGLVTLALVGCSRGKLSYYEQGDLNARVFSNHISQKDQLSDEYYAVVRDDEGHIKSAKHFSEDHQLIEKSSYSYTRDGQIKRHHSTEYFDHGPPRIARDWIYEKSRLIKREEKWFTRSRLLEKRLTVHYDEGQKPYLEETWGLGNKIENSTEYYYDYKHRLDKSRRNFFHSDGSLRDYWLTIYNNRIQIVTEEHYLPDNSLIAFYRYTYHPVKDYREFEEILDENKNLFLVRQFDEYGHLIVEEVKTRDLNLIKRLVYEYDQHQKPKLVRHYDSQDKLVKTSPYKKLRTIGGFRTS